jgi:hypothetical protein
MSAYDIPREAWRGVCVENPPGHIHYWYFCQLSLDRKHGRRFAVETNGMARGG